MRKMFKVVSGVFLASALCTGFATAQELSEDRVKQLALEAILENPSVIYEAVAIMEAKQREDQAAAAGDFIGSLGQDVNTPTMGNPDGDVTVYEFFDYNCPYCRKAGAVVERLIAVDSNVKVVYREWPILGENSDITARASLAADMQGRYDDLHWALMKSNGRANEASIMRMARDLGLDVEKLQADMKSPQVQSHIYESNRLARGLGFTGTPAFVVGDVVAPGLLSLEDLQSLIAQERAN